MAQGVVAVRDEANGYLCFDFRAWGQCFPFTPTAGASPAATVTATSTQRPTATPAPLPDFANADFESVEYGNPAGWQRVTLAGNPEWNSESAPPGDALAVFSGARSVRFIGHYACWRAGVAQTIPAPAGRTVTISAQFLTMGSGITGLRNADPNMNSELGIGVDRYAAGDPLSGDVVWKYGAGENLAGPLVGGNWEPVWTRLALTLRIPTDAQNITVYFVADMGRTREGKCNWSLPQTLAFIDHVELTP